MSSITGSLKPETATTTRVATGRYAMGTYPVHLKGGTGRYGHATGDFTNIGEAGLNTGQIVLRLHGADLFREWG